MPFLVNECGKPVENKDIACGLFYICALRAHFLTSIGSVWVRFCMFLRIFWLKVVENRRFLGKNMLIDVDKSRDFELQKQTV